MTTRKRSLLICGLGAIVIALVLFWPTGETELAPGEDPPCFASKLGLPCRP